MYLSLSVYRLSLCTELGPGWGWLGMKYCELFLHPCKYSPSDRGFLDRCVTARPSHTFWAKTSLPPHCTHWNTDCSLGIPLWKEREGAPSSGRRGVPMLDTGLGAWLQTGVQAPRHWLSVFVLRCTHCVLGPPLPALGNQLADREHSLAEGW